MADAWLWENGDRILLEDSSGVWILETQSGGGGGGGGHGGPMVLLDPPPPPMLPVPVPTPV